MHASRFPMAFYVIGFVCNGRWIWLVMGALSDAASFLYSHRELFLEFKCVIPRVYDSFAQGLARDS